MPATLSAFRSTLLEVRDKSIRMCHEMINDETGELVAITVIVGVHLDTTIRKARSLPPDVRERALLMIHWEEDIGRRESTGALLEQCRQTDRNERL